MKLSIKVFNKLVISFLFVIPRYAQITENSNFVTSLQYLKKKSGVMKLILYADKHQIILQVNTINLVGHGQACPNYPK